MHRSNIYLSFIFLLIGLFLFSFHYLRYQKDIVLEQDGYQLESIDESQCIFPHAEPLVFIIDNGDQGKKVYKFEGYEKDNFSRIDLLYYDVDSARYSNDYYFIESLKGNLPLGEKLENLSYDALYDIVHSSDDFEARQLIQHNLESGIFGYIDTMPLVFLLFGFVAGLVLKILDAFKYLLYRLFRFTHTSIVFNLLMLSCLVFLLSGLRMVPWYPFSAAGSIVRSTIVLFPMYLGCQWVVRRIFIEGRFWRNQFILFMSLLLLGLFLLWLGTRIGVMIDSSQYDKIISLPYFSSYNSLAIGFLFSFCVGLMLMNLVGELFPSLKLNSLS